MIAKVSETFFVSPQLLPAEMQELADAGFGTVICNRPDDEEPGQPGVAILRDAAEASGMAFHHIPVSGGAFPASAIEAFAAVRAGAAGKVLAFCRSGTRSITLDALANVDRAPAELRIERARQAGYDLSALRERLNE